MYTFDERFRTEAAGDARVANHFLIARLPQGLDSAPFAKYPADVFLCGPCTLRFAATGGNRDSQRSAAT